MSTQNEHHGSIQQTLLRPYRLATILAAIALFVSLGFLTFTAWSSARRLDPLERHLTHLQGLQDSSLGIQELLIRHIEQNSPPLPEEIARIRSGLQEILDRGDHMHADTPAALREAMTFLQSDNANPEAGLLAALSVIRDTLKRENTLQRESVAATREAAQVEVLVAGAALILAPLSSFLLLAYIRRRSFRSLRLLSDLLENVGNLDFRTMEPPGENDPLTDVFQRYNLMADRLRKARDEQNRREETLEHQVRAASETLLRQQSDLADGARLAALGEFSARVAHELRNPISGITLALRNLESETEVDDHRERIGLVVEEMDRITRLLNTLLE
ncbi:MAG: hypothetical protein KDJ77_19870, partial [Rhodobiaceae bacterium]|nr:hypothetical protein [Rhodobiaceae bacterium]